MRKMLTIGVALLLIYECSGQQNAFPAIGNVGIGTTTPTYKLTLDVANTRDGISIKSDGNTVDSCDVDPLFLDVDLSACG